MPQVRPLEVKCLELGDLRVLAPGTGEIAADRPYRKDLALGQKMIERLLLDGIDLNRDCPAIDDQPQRPFQIAAHTTLTACPRSKRTPVLTGSTLDVSLTQRPA